MKNKGIYYSWLALLSALILPARILAQLTIGTSEPWYKNSLIYNLEVGTFKDGDGDGIGDFKGLSTKLGYLDSMGVDVIWLAPFTPSPGKDDGYDVQDYDHINPKYGTMADFEFFLNQAHKRKMKVITDIVLNHTSIAHPWFQKSRSDTSGPYHKWYVWSKQRPKDANKGMVFPGVQQETWTYDSLAHAFYFHRFYDFQPDLNFTNTEVQQEAFRILQYWLKKGIDGFRLDAVPFIIDIPETGSENPDRMMYLIPKMRNMVKAVKPDALLLGEANLSPEENKDYFGENNNGMQMMFNFYVNQHLFYALATQKLRPLLKAIADTKEKPQQAQWAHFLRNHDEIDLDRLGKKRKEEVYAAFGPDSSMQLYNRGIRRRLAPMLQDDKKIRMAYALLFSLPGTPVIRYGEEIGMGDDLSLKERLSVRTPMQWSAAPHAGFTMATKPFRKVIDTGAYGFKKINVASQLSDPNSLLNFVKKTIDLRKQCPEIGLGDFRVIKTSSKYVLAICYQFKGKTLLTLCNFSDQTQRFKLKNKQLKKQRAKALYTDSQSQLTNKLTLTGYGFEWYRLKETE